MEQVSNVTQSVLAPAFPEPVVNAPAFPEPVVNTPAFPEPVVNTPAFPEPVVNAPAFPEPVVNTPAFPVGVKKTKKSGPVRHSRKVIRNNLNGITKSDIRRLARRGGIKRMNGAVYDDARSALKEFLTTTIRDATIYMEFAKRKTVTTADVCYALKRNGRTLYGF
jgi:histone H4